MLMNETHGTKKAVAIHNKNGQGLLPSTLVATTCSIFPSQSTIKMDKGYYIYATSPSLKLISSRNPQ